MEPEEVGLAQDDQRDRAETWEEINRRLLTSARRDRLENGKVVRVDSTVTAAFIHAPSDNSLLWDAVRVMVRLLYAADALGSASPWHDHCRAAKKRARTIEYARSSLQRIKSYRELLRITRTTLSDLQQAAQQLPGPRARRSSFGGPPSATASR
jgi:IS5 family transposase